MTQKNKMIGLSGSNGAGPWLAILSSLAESCGIGLRQVSAGGLDGLIGVIVLGKGAFGAETQSLAEFRLVPVDGQVVQRASVRFRSHPEVPEPFRNKELTTLCVVPENADASSGSVMATAEGRPVWISSVVEEQRHDTCWIAADTLDQVVGAFDRLNGKRFMDLLPVLEWMRAISGFYEWTRPPLRACLMFDDPNLHSVCYGYVDYARIAAEGRQHRYHTSFATVPFDAYYVNPAAARCFREHPDTLSLLVHGNNHTHRELAGGKDQQERLAQMRQALQRMKRLDQKAGPTTAKVMAPPHGACSEAMMRAMRDAGFEAACISPASVRSANPDAMWKNDLGLYPAAMISGFPVIPRFRLEAQREGSIWLAMYLDQPFILVGHHWDLAEGTDLLAETAKIINGLGDVVWADLATIARRNYRHRIESNRLRIQPFCRILHVDVPEGVTEIEIEAPWLEAGSARFVGRSHGESLVGGQTIDAKGNGTTISVHPGSRVDLELIEAESSPPTPKPPRTPLPALARRILVEMRDRSMPHLPKKWVRG
jgi:hypothetical protein